MGFYPSLTYFRNITSSLSPLQSF